MGVLSDIIVAGREEASAILESDGGHMDRWPSLDSKGIDTIKLGTLWTILSGGSLDDIDSVVSFMGDDALVAQSSDDGPWVYAVPQKLTNALASMDENAQRRVAITWSETEEFQLDGWSPVEVERYLESLAQHARQAKETGKPLLLWMSL